LGVKLAANAGGGDKGGSGFGAGGQIQYSADDPSTSTGPAVQIYDPVTKSYSDYKGSKKRFSWGGENHSTKQGRDTFSFFVVFLQNTFSFLPVCKVKNTLKRQYFLFLTGEYSTWHCIYTAAIILQYCSALEGLE
jgi:hypothetical protein